MIELQIYHNQNLIKTEQFDKALISIGRAKLNDICLDSKSVSNQHARIIFKDNDYYIFDLTSSNGTFIDGVKIEDSKETAISPKNIITLGEYHFKIKTELNKNKQIDKKESKSSDFYNDLYIMKIKEQIQTKLYDEIDLRRLDINKINDEMLKQQCRSIIEEIINRLKITFPDKLIQEEVICDILDEAIGLGPLDKLMQDEDISEIMVARKDKIFIEKGGKIAVYPKTFSSNESLIGIISRMVNPIGRHVDESSPMVDVRLKDGSRVNIIIPPLALEGPSITIRKFSRKKITMDDLIQFDTLNENMKKFLEICVKHKNNIIISGGTGSGKTTTLNILGSYISEGDRIITIEDTAELKLNEYHNHIIRLEARPPNIEGEGEITIRQLVRNALRMRCDRIICGECRGAEAFDCLQAMNTGHSGSMVTAHSNSPEDMLLRLENMVVQAGQNLPSRAIREQIVSAINIVVQQNRFECGSRKITNISELTGIDEDGKIIVQDIFYFKIDGIDKNNKIKGSFMATGWIPEFFDKLQKRGIDVDMSIFNNA